MGYAKGILESKPREFGEESAKFRRFYPGDAWL